ncbi:lysozyme [Thauera aromatica]|uniref:lysozyme n=1 Tax=Thauera aromatica TaxID=59405 RepID=UPI001FFCA3AD|nr:lysozyme [Thauera aromatica]MCK2095648.1 lysozyme [Thauera aromatica]
MRKAALGLTASALVVGSLAGYEGYREHAYLDSVGVPTLGFGTTAGVRMGQRTDPVRAVQRLATDADAFARQVGACIGDVPVAQHEFDAFVSLAYNIGGGAFCASTLVKKLRQSPPDYSGACAQILRWSYAGGKIEPGLVTRRKAEYRQCMGAAQ